MTNDVLQIRVDRRIKKDASSILDSVGLDMSTAIRMFLKKIISENAIPFDILGDDIYIKSDHKKVYTMDDIKKYAGCCTGDYKDIDIDTYIKEGRFDRKFT